MRTAERGFSLLEVVVAVALFAIASAATAGALAAVARGAASPSARDAALMTAENALVRARAAVAYASSPDQDGTVLLGGRTWGLVAGTTAYVAGAEIRAPFPCRAPSALRVRMPVSAAFDPASQRFSVSVSYPRDACAVAADGTIPPTDTLTVTLVQTLPPSVFPPGQRLVRDVLTPARM
jgi:prepilin-type N-terminal cleavage/methylation domain-containing protein